MSVIQIDFADVLSRSGWRLPPRGLVVIGFVILTLFQPAISLAVLAFLFAVYALSTPLGARTSMFIVGMCVSCAVYSSNYNFVYETPYFTYFTEQDRKRLQQELAVILDEGKDGETRRWNNDATGAHGELTPLRTQVAQGKTCRDVRVVNHASGRSGESRQTFCRAQDGPWIRQSRQQTQ